MNKNFAKSPCVLGGKRILPGGLLLISLSIPLAVNAADPNDRWDGLHVGINAGYGWNNDQGSQTCNNANVCPSMVTGFSTHVAASGFFGGGQIGFNRQFDNLVLGLEADMQGAGIYGSMNTKPSAAPISLPGGGAVLIQPAIKSDSFQAAQQIDWLGTVRGLFGVSLWDRALVYATGGLAYGGVKANSQLTVPSGMNFSGAASETPAGWVAGGGLEYAVSNSFSAKIEGLYYDLGQIQVKEASNTKPSLLIGNLASESLNKTFDINGPLVRIGLNYRF